MAKCYDTRISAPRISIPEGGKTMAYLTVVSVTVVTAQRQDAVEKTQALANHVNQIFSGSIRIIQSMDGPEDRYHWIQENESLAQWESDQEKWASDPVAQEWVATGQHEYWTDHETHRYRIL
jgi:hypothetical protein